MSFLPLYFYFIALCLIVALFVYSKTKHPLFKYFPIFLFATLSTEFVGNYLKSINKPNAILYNFFSIAEFVFYIVIIREIIKSPKVKKIMLWGVILYSVISFSNIVFFQGIDRFHTVTYSLGCLFIVISCAYYFFEIFRLPGSEKLLTNPAFWICSGLLFFYCCSFPLYAFLNYWWRFSWMRKGFTDIINILNIFLYSMFIIAFLCSRTRKYTLSSS